jgi:toxin secretion/phage lysis holin
VELIELYKEFYHSNVLSHPIFLAYLGVVLFDVLAGFARAWVTKTYQSTIARQGISSHALILLAATLAYPVLNKIGLGSIGDSVLLFYVAANGTSIIANLAAIGIPFPDFIKKWVTSELDEKQAKD